MKRPRVQTVMLVMMIEFPLSVMSLGGANCVPPPPGVQPPPGIQPPPPAIFPAESRSTSIALTYDDRLLVVANREANTVTILEVRGPDGADVANKVAEIGVGQEPRSVAIKPDNSEAYVACAASGNVSIIALTGDHANRVIAEVPVGEEPRGCALTPNGTRLLVANHTAGTVSIIDTAQRKVVGTANVGGNPWALAITNNGDEEDNDETVFVTQFFAELIPGGPGEGFDNGKQAIVQAFPLNNPAAITRITLSPLDNVGFTGDRSNFCRVSNANAFNETFCPDTTVTDANSDKIKKDPQGAFPNQLASAILRAGRLFLPNIGAAPEPPLGFNINVQALVHVVDAGSKSELKDQHVNLNAQIKVETEPAAADAPNTLTRVFGNDIVAIDASKDASTMLIVSRGGNYVLRANLGPDGKITINAAADKPAVRFQTGNLPSGVVISGDGKRAYTNNEVSLSVSALNLENNTVIDRDIPSSTDPAAGSFEHAVLVGKLAFFTALGVPDNGLLSMPIRSIEPLKFRGKQSNGGWSSCASCHPDGLSDRVTWIFDTGPRNTISLDAFFAKDNPNDQRISNWNAVRGSVTDFNNNSRNVQGGIGFAGNPPNPNVYNHGITQGASDALDLQTLWVQTIRTLNMPKPADSAAAGRGRTLFATNCASCHGGAKWTKSQVIYLDNPAFDRDPAAQNNPGTPRDPGITRAAAQIISYTVGGQTLKFIEDVGTFSANSPIEIRNNGTKALGEIGFNVPSVLGVGYTAPYLHHGAAQTLEDVLTRHKLGAGTIGSTLNASEQADLITFLKSIDGSTEPLQSDTDKFRDAIGG